MFNKKCNIFFNIYYMENIKRFKKYINENYGMNLSASFGMTDLSTVKGGVPAQDPELSFNPFDRHKNDMIDNFKRVVSIFGQIGHNNNNTIFEFSIDELSILRIYRNNNGTLDVYIKFMYNEEVSYGTFKNWGGLQEPTFNSNILNKMEFRVGANLLKLIGSLKESLKKWFQPLEDNNYVALKDIKVYTQMGNIYILPQGANVLIEDVIVSDTKPIIYLIYNDNIYTITGLDYYYFHWWFELREKKKFYL